MNKPLIKVFKRLAETGAEIQAEPEVLGKSLKAERKKRLEIVKTITGWIDERREHNHLTEIIARRMIPGNPLTSRK